MNKTVRKNLRVRLGDVVSVHQASPQPLISRFKTRVLCNSPDTCLRYCCVRLSSPDNGYLHACSQQQALTSQLQYAPR